MALSAIQLIRDRIAQVSALPEATARFAGPRIEEKLRRDATTRRGNVPSFGDLGDVPVAVRVEGSAIHVNAPDWVLGKAQQKGQTEEWEQIIRDTADELASGVLK